MHSVGVDRVGAQSDVPVTKISYLAAIVYKEIL